MGKFWYFISKRSSCKFGSQWVRIFKRTKFLCLWRDCMIIYQQIYLVWIKVRLKLVFIFKKFLWPIHFFRTHFLFVWNNKRNKMRWEVVSNQVPLDLKSSMRTSTPFHLMICIVLSQHKDLERMMNSV